MEKEYAEPPMDQDEWMQAFLRVIIKVSGEDASLEDFERDPLVVAFRDNVRPVDAAFDAMVEEGDYDAEDLLPMFQEHGFEPNAETLESHGLGEDEEENNEEEEEEKQGTGGESKGEEA